MSAAAAGRAASKAGQAVGRAATKANEAGGKKGSDNALNKFAKKDPELYILLTIMTGAFGMAGYHFGSSPESG
ncbi:MAG: hypothetical protein Q9164_002726 [Protoblastenia rupestris]